MKSERAIKQSTPGAVYRGNGVCEFSVWAPFSKSIAARIVSRSGELVSLQRDSRGYWRGRSDDLLPGTRYFYRINDEKDRPDPASRSQPEGVHGPSELTDPDAFRWTDALWHGIPLHHYIIYELHVGTFTTEGTFDAAIFRLDYLIELGITAIEIMPVAQFPGDRNWGYDGVYPFAPQNSYGGGSGLKRLVDACHRKGLAVILDVVYNHLGPDGNYLNDFGPYFTVKYKTPWGDAVNFDGPFSDEVRAYFIENALYWVTEFHLDALRVDAVDTIYDFSARHFLAELAAAVHRRAAETDRQIFVIAESDLNDTRIINPVDRGGYGIDAQWSDDLHHSLHALITGERKGYYQDFGSIEHLAKAFREGFVYSGGYSRYRSRKHGNSSKDVSPRQLVVCTQNHDQVGNRMLGDRLSMIVSFEQLKLAATCVILSPFTPLLFMGEEYGETAPFQYFVHHLDEQLIKAVREGRTFEFAHFEWMGSVPDPQDEQTFLRCKINPGLRTSGKHMLLYEYYRSLIRTRKTVPALAVSRNDSREVSVMEQEQVLFVRTWHDESQAMIVYCFGEQPSEPSLLLPAGSWRKMLESSSPLWGGSTERAPGMIRSGGHKAGLPMNGHSAVLYVLQEEAMQ